VYRKRGLTRSFFRAARDRGRLRITVSRSTWGGPIWLGHGSGAHAPDEYYVIESKNPRSKGWTAPSARFVEVSLRTGTIKLNPLRRCEERVDPIASRASLVSFIEMEMPFAPAQSAPQHRTNRKDVPRFRTRISTHRLKSGLHAKESRAQSLE